MTSPTILSTKGLTRRFETGTDSVGIVDVGFDVRQGEVICLVGPSGSGKTTLLRCLAGIEPVDSGSIVLLGEHPIHERTAQSTRVRQKNVAMVFQDCNLWPHLTVMENIVLAPIMGHGVPREIATERANSLLEKIGLSSKKDAYPSALSGGERQRVAIVRALVTEPKLLLLDEITSALDPELVSDVLNVIKTLAGEGQSMVIATHHMKFASEVATRILFLEKGRVIQEATARDFVHDQQNSRIKDFVSAV